eukprot:3191618-Alexandrium_andersonii.AAC.1
MAHRCCGGESGATDRSAVLAADTTFLSGASTDRSPLPLEHPQGQLGVVEASEQSGGCLVPQLSHE